MSDGLTRERGPFQIQVASVCKPYSQFVQESCEVGLRINRVYGVVGLAGEAGELANEVKKAVFHRKPENREAVLLEMGDVLWYLQLLCNQYDTTLEEVCALNRRKLVEQGKAKE